MAVVPTNGALPTPEQLAGVNGAPSFMATNLLDNLQLTPFAGDMGSAMEWRIANNQNSGTSIPDANQPLTRIADRNAHTFSKPSDGSISAVNVVYIHIQLDGTTARLLDTIHILPNNFADILGPTNLNTTMTVAVDGTDAANPSFAGAEGTGWTRFMSVSAITDDTEIIDINLENTYQEYHTVDLIRISFGLTAGNFSTHEPEIALVQLGKRRQIAHFPEEQGFDPNALRSVTSTYIAESQASKRHVFAKGQGFFDHNFQTTADGFLAINEITKIDEFFVDSDYGARNFLFIDQPELLAPRGHWVRMVNPEVTQPFVGPSERRSRIEMEELPPFQSQR